MRILLVSLLLSLASLCGCADLPTLAGRSVSATLTDTAQTRLGRAIQPRLSQHTGDSGIVPLRDARDSFAARMLLARAAERILDIQYYIWRPDLTGTLLFDELRAAGARGVRVRLLLDDNNTSGLDPTLAMLAAQPNIEVRLFNPYALRGARWLGLLTDFGRLNRRMHNKSFTADNQATIVGGRNIGDEYFGATNDLLFFDLDVMAVGPVVADVSTDFDRYWASGSSYPAERLLPPAPADALETFAASLARAKQSPHAVVYTNAVRDSRFIDRLSSGEIESRWAPTRMVSDDPDKGLGLAAPSGLIFRHLEDVLGGARHDVEIVSPYFVPTRAGVDALAAMARRGVDVRVLTNSLEATDVVAVHAGYAKRRKAMLRAGIRLYELRRQSGSTKAPKGSSGPGGSSASSLHAKTFAADHARVFVGSFNFDPRSVQLNTELGFVIESPAMAIELADGFDRNVPQLSWEVRLSPSGHLVWVERRGEATVTFDHEPGVSIWKRALVGLLSHLPIEWLL